MTEDITNNQGQQITHDYKAAWDYEKNQNANLRVQLKHAEEKLHDLKKDLANAEALKTEYQGRCGEMGR